MKPYPEYKPTGLAWLPEIPKHWDVVPLAAYAKEKSITNQTDLELLSVYLDRGVIRFSEVSAKRTNVTSEDLSKYQRVDVGDLVLNNQQAWRGSVGVSPYTGIVSPAYIVLELSDKLHKRFANYLFRDNSMVTHYAIASKGIGSIQRNLYWINLKRKNLFLPPFPEQAQIVRYLDAMTAKINKLIRAKKRQIALLQEQKQAIINQAVTRGLDPDVELKDSGIDWLGPIPKHWEIVTLKRLCSMHSGTNLTSEEIDELGIYPVYGGNGFRGYYSLYNCSGECVLVGRQGALAGNVHYVDGKFWATDHALITRCSKLTGYLYLSYLLKAMNLNQYAFQTAAQPGLAAGTILSLQTVIPSCEEQFQISDFLDSFCKKINDAIETTEKQISHCEEYKNSLISSVVTGQVDVRNTAVEEVDPADLITDDVAISSDDDIADLSEESPTTESEE